MSERHSKPASTRWFALSGLHIQRASCIEKEMMGAIRPRGTLLRIKAPRIGRFPIDEAFTNSFWVGLRADCGNWFPLLLFGYMQPREIKASLKLH
jgi:hypothetical protein